MKLTILIGIMLGSVALWSQPTMSAAPVDLCALLKSPASFNGLNVTIQGQIKQSRTGFHGIPVIDGVAITGALRMNSATCPGDGYVSVEFAKNVRTGQDPETERLKALLHARRAFTPNGEECGGECSYYNVSARVSGRISALGRDSYLLIEHASDIAITRTRIPFGGFYRCENDQWVPSAAEWISLGRPVTVDSENDKLLLYSKIAAHWHDAPVSESGLYRGRSQEWTDWVSTDLMRGYSYVYTERIDGQVTGGIYRYACVARSRNESPREPAGEIRCEQLVSKRTKSERGTLELSARKLVRAVFEEWRKTPPLLKKNNCSHFRDGQYQYGRCSFSTVDGLISVGIDVWRKQPGELQPRPWSEIPWKVEWIDASICSISR